MLICWSGGCDSTLALWHYAKSSSLNFPIKAISINHDQVPAQAHQQAARERILRWMKEKGFHIKHMELEVNHGKDLFDPVKNGLVQPSLWLGLACPFLEKDEDLILGYIHGDWATENLHHIQEIFNHTQLMGGKTGKLVLPFSSYSKYHIITELRECGLLDLTWYCEGNGLDEDVEKAISCGYCDSCITHLKALLVDVLRSGNRNAEQIRKYVENIVLRKPSSIGEELKIACESKSVLDKENRENRENQEQLKEGNGEINQANLHYASV